MIKHCSPVLILFVLTLFAPSLLADETPTLAKWEKKFPHLVFEDDFNNDQNGTYPDGWKVLLNRNSPNARVENGEFEILTGGNIHLIQPIALDNFLLTCKIKGSPEIKEKRFCPCLCFRVPETSADTDPPGYYLVHSFGCDPYGRSGTPGTPFMASNVYGRAPAIANHFSLLRLHNTISPNLKQLDKNDENNLTFDFFDNRIFHDFALVANGNRFILYQDGNLVADFTDTNQTHSKGLLGFCMEGSWSAVPGKMVVDDVKVYAAKPLSTKKVIVTRKNNRIPNKYNRLHGTPLLFDFEIAQQGKEYTLSGSAHGGCCESGNPKARHPSHQLVNPYVHLTTADGRQSSKLDLFHGTVGNIQLHHIPFYGPSDTPGPVSAKQRFDFSPAQCRVAVGYDRYTICPLWQDGACEMIINPSNGHILYKGPPLKDNLVASVQSPPEKPLILNRIPQDHPYRNGFKDFLVDNHYFVEGHPVTFKADLIMALPREQVGRCEVKILDAFKERTLSSRQIKLTADNSPLSKERKSLGLINMTSDWIDFGALPVGVYHIELNVQDHNEKTLRRHIKAFTVLPEKVDLAQTPAERSGLPTVWAGMCYPFAEQYQVDAYHYLSISNEPKNRIAVTDIKTALNMRTVIDYIDVTDKKLVEEIRKRSPNIEALWLPNLPDDLTRKIARGRLVYTIEQESRNFLYQYVNSPSVPEALRSFSSRKLERKDYDKLLHSIKKDGYWSSYTDFVSQSRAKNTKKGREILHNLLPGVKTGSYGYPLPCVTDYMTPYSALNSFGINLQRDGWLRDLVLVEAYFPENNYPADRDWACWALMKMVHPQSRYFWDDEGEIHCVEDSNVSTGWPPFGKVETGEGYTKKSICQNAFNPIFFKDGRFQWAWDKAYHLYQHPPEVFGEILEAFSLAHHITPQKPLPGIGYLYSLKWLEAFPVSFDPNDYPFNTASESVVFAYEEGNRHSVPNGFFFEPDELENMSPEKMTAMIVPPMTSATETEKQRIRDLRAKGVNLICFESVPGLEDIFGVKKANSPQKVATVKIADNDLAASVFRHTKQISVSDSGSKRTLNYELADDAVSLLDCYDENDVKIGPALVLNKTRDGSTLFWTLAPTDIARSACRAGSRNRGECQSELIRTAMGEGLKLVANTPITASEGKLNAFWDTKDRLAVMVCEDAHPYPSRPIHPLVSVKLPNSANWKIESDKAHEVITNNGELQFHFDLERNEYVTFIITTTTRKSTK